MFIYTWNHCDCVCVCVFAVQRLTALILTLVLFCVRRSCAAAGWNLTQHFQLKLMFQSNRQQRHTHTHLLLYRNITRWSAGHWPPRSAAFCSLKHKNNWFTRSFSLNLPVHIPHSWVQTNHIFFYSFIIFLSLKLEFLIWFVIRVSEVWVKALVLKRDDEESQSFCREQRRRRERRKFTSRCWDVQNKGPTLRNGSATDQFNQSGE